MKRQKVRPSSAGNDHHQPFNHRNYDEAEAEQINLVRVLPKRNELEAEVLDGDTLQAIAIRHNCSVSDIKRLNKIERDLEIHARKTIKVPLNAGNFLVNNLPTVHKSGQSSPKHQQYSDAVATSVKRTEDIIIEAIRNLPDSSFSNCEPTINDIILNTTITPNVFHDETETLESGLLEEDLLLDPDAAGGSSREPRPIIASRRTDISFSGADCDMSWICLFIFILALCFAIPLIYVIYIAEHHVDPEAVPHNSGTH